MHPALKWGVALGVSVIVWTLLLHAMGVYTEHVRWARTADNIAIIFPSLFITIALRQQAAASGPPLSWLRGLQTGIAVGLVAFPISFGFLAFYHRVVNPEWMDYLASWEQIRLTATGMPAADIAEQVRRLRASGSDLSLLIGGLVGTVIMSAALSALVTGIIRTGQRRAARVTASA